MVKIMHISTMIHGLEIRVDKRTELLSIIEIISDYRKKYPFLLEKYGNKNHVIEIENKFRRYQNHKVVQLFNYLTLNYDFSFSVPIKLFLQLNDDFSFSYLSDDTFSKRLNKDPKVLELLSLLSDFAEEIKFDTYYFGNEEKYRLFIHNVANQLIGLDIVGFMNKYYGITESKKFIVNLIPWRTYGCYGTCSNDDLYTHLCCHHESKNENDIYPNDDQIFNYSSFLVHEFSHSFINPLTDKYSLITEDNSIFDDIWDKMKKLGYRSNKSILNDHIVRAITLRYLFLQRNDLSYYNKQLETDENWGFSYIRNIMNSLEIYEKNRNEYKNMDEFYPLLIQSLVEEKKKNINHR